MTRIYTLFLLLLTSFVSTAHTGSMKGKIMDAYSKRPLENAVLSIAGKDLNTITDHFGNYFLKGIEPGKYEVELRLINYEIIKDSIVIEDGVTMEKVFFMIPDGIDLNAVTINAQKESSYETISNLDIKLRPVNSSQDLLRLVPGLFIAQHQGGGKAEQIFLRGFDVDHGTDVNVTVDGMPVNMVSHAHGQGYADLHWLMPETIESLDFGKGSGTIDKGNLATAGWVSFKTKNILEDNFVKLEAGQYGFYRIAGGLNLIDQKHSGNNDAYIAGAYNYNRSYFENPQDYNRYNLIGKYTHRISAGKTVSVTGTAFKSNWKASGQIPERAVRSGLISRFGEIAPEKGITSRYNINVQYDQKINDHSYIRSNLFVANYNFDLFSNFTFFLEDSVNGDQIRQKENRILNGYNFEYNDHYSLLGLKNKSEAGFGYRNDITSNSELSNTHNFTDTENRIVLGDINETNIFGYVQQSVFLTDDLVLHAGTRYDHFLFQYTDNIPVERTRSTNDKGTISPKAGLNYTINNKARIFFNYGTGFHSNDSRLVLSNTVNDILPRSNSYDLGMVIKPGKNILIATTLWALYLQQEFVYVGDAGIVEPSGRTRRIGIDGSIRASITKWLFADLDINYCYGRSLDAPVGEQFIPLAPSITSIGGLSTKFKNGFSSAIRYRYIGDRAANEDGSVQALGYTVCDLSASYTIRKFEIGMQIQNLFNVDWNEAQFDTETRLRNETSSVSEIHFTPGTPFFAKLILTYKF